MGMRKKLLGVAIFAFVASFGVGGLVLNASADVATEKASFVMVEGAQVRTDDPSGIRFITDVNEAYKTELAQTYPTETHTWVWGTELTFTDVAENSWTVDAVTEKWIDNDTRWYTALVGIPDTDYLTEITAESYVKIYDAENTLVDTKTVSNAQTRSIAYSASWALNDGYDQEILYTYTKAISNTSVELDKESESVVEDTEIQLTANVQPAGYGVAWRSSDTSVATVDKNGKVTAINAGEAIITATLGNATDSYQLTVTASAESQLVTKFYRAKDSNYAEYPYELANVNDIAQEGNFAYGTALKTGGTYNSGTMYVMLSKEYMGTLFADTTVNAITFDIILSTGTANIQRGNNAETLTTTSTNIGTYTDGENSYYSYSVTVTRWHYEKYAQTADLILRYTGGGTSIFFFVDNIATVGDYTTALYEDKLVTEFANKTSSDRTLQALVKTNTLGDENDVYGVAKIVAPKSATMYLTISYAYLQELFTNTKVRAITFDIILDQEKKLQLAGKDFSACTGNPSFTTEEVKIGNKTYYEHTVTLTREYFASISKDVALRYIYHKDESGVNHYTAEPTCMYIDNLALVK